MKTIEEIVVDALRADFADLMRNTSYYSEYDDTLDILGRHFELGGAVGLINSSLKTFHSWSAHHGACFDVASTLESLAPEKYKGKFNYKG